MEERDGEQEREREGGGGRILKENANEQMYCRFLSCPQD